MYRITYRVSHIASCIKCVTFSEMYRFYLFNISNPKIHIVNRKISLQHWWWQEEKRESAYSIPKKKEKKIVNNDQITCCSFSILGTAPFLRDICYASICNMISVLHNANSMWSGMCIIPLQGPGIKTLNMCFRILYDADWNMCHTIRIH